MDQPEPISSLKSYAVAVGRALLYFGALVLASGMVAGMNYAIQRLTGQGLPVAPVPVIPAPHTDPAAEPQTDPAAAPHEYEGARYETPECYRAKVLGQGGPAFERMAAAGGPRKWPTRDITWTVDPAGLRPLNPPLAEDAVIEAFRQAWQAWAAVVDIAPRYVPPTGPAMVRIGFGPVEDGDGRRSGVGGTLAWSELADGTTNPKDQRYDSAERWTVGPPARGLISLVVVAIHEIGHVLGLTHDAERAAAIMRPFYDPSIPLPTARDFDRLAALGYPRRPAPPPTPGPANTITAPALIRTDDLIDPLRKLGWTVQPK